MNIFRKVHLSAAHTSRCFNSELSIYTSALYANAFVQTYNSVNTANTHLCGADLGERGPGQRSQTPPQFHPSPGCCVTSRSSFGMQRASLILFRLVLGLSHNPAMIWMRTVITTMKTDINKEKYTTFGHEFIPFLSHLKPLS